MRIPTTRDEAESILAAMSDVATAGRGEPSFADRTALASAARWLFGPGPETAGDALPQVDPPRLARALRSPALRVEAVRFLTVMAFVDGALDPAKIARVLAYAGGQAVQSGSLS
jgi:hypothetical protein